MTGSATSHHQPSEPVQTWCESACSCYFIVAWHCGVWNLAVSGRFQHQDHMSVKQIHGSQSAGCDGFSLFIAFPNREKTSCWNDGAHRTLSLIHGDKNFWRTVQGATPCVEVETTVVFATYCTSGLATFGLFFRVWDLFSIMNRPGQVLQASLCEFDSLVGHSSRRQSPISEITCLATGNFGVTIINYWVVLALA